MNQSMLLLCIVNARSGGDVNICVPAINREIRKMAWCICAPKLREDASQDAMTFFIEKIWPRVQTSSNNFQAAAYVRIRLHGRLVDFATKEARHEERYPTGMGVEEWEVEEKREPQDAEHPAL